MDRNQHAQTRGKSKRLDRDPILTTFHVKMPQDDDLLLNKIIHIHLYSEKNKC